ncbi:MAG: sugar phosphate isomerase/epimerase [Bacteroidales bacterium]|nr:sugar phosphate isomerase/epimerase [Bacteroidales bacterium]
MTTRRDFIKTSSIMAAGSVVLPLSSFVSEKSAPYGLILYTVRDDMKKDPMGTLEKVASIGYEVVEAAGYSNREFYGMKPAKFKEAVESFGMKLLSSHNGVTEENVKEIAEDAAEAGLKYVVKPSMSHDGIDDFKRGAEMYNKFGEIFNDAGIRFGYHNHSFEFEKIDDVIPYDILLQETDPTLVTMELDLYWIVKGGHDPWEYFEKFPGRFELWHVKDMKESGKQYETEVGNGIIDFKKIFFMKKLAGLKNYFVEEDNCRDFSTFESIQISLDYIKKMKF